jgi:hypothetical protein
MPKKRDIDREVEEMFDIIERTRKRREECCKLHLILDETTPRYTKKIPKLRWWCRMSVESNEPE